MSARSKGSCRVSKSVREKDEGVVYRPSGKKSFFDTQVAKSLFDTQVAKSLFDAQVTPK